MTDNVVGRRITLLRETRDMTQTELAKLLNCSVSAISDYESGTRKPSFDLLILLADYFDTTTDYLLGRRAIALRAYLKTKSCTKR